MRLKTVAIATTAILVGAAVAAIAIIQSTDFNQYRSMIAEQAKVATGRDLVIAGDLGFALLPSPRLKVEDLTFANAPGGSRPEMVKLRSLEAEVELLPLIVGDIRVRRLILIGPDVLLETDAQGRGNWEIARAGAPAAPAPAAPSGGPARLPTVNEVEIRDATIVYRDAKTGARHHIVVAKLIGKADGVDSPLRLDLEAVADDVPIAARATLGALAHLGQARPWPVSVDAKIASMTVKIDGMIAAPLEGKGYDLTATASAPELAELARLVGRALPPLGPLKLSARISERAGAPAVSDLKVEIGKAELLLVRVEGSVSDVTKPAGIDLAVTAEGKDLTPLNALAGTNLAALAPLRLALRAADGQGGYALTGIDIKAGQSDLAGTASIAVSGVRPRLRADLASKLLDIDALAGGVGKPSQPAAASAPAAAAARGDGRVIPDMPIPLELLLGADAEIKLRADRVNAGGIALQAVALDVALAAADLRVKPAAQLAGGKFDGEVTAAAKTAQVSVKVNLRSLAFGGLLNEMKLTDLLSGGKVDAEIDLKGPARDLRGLAGGLQGHIGLAVGEGRLATKYADFIAADLIKGLAPWGMGEQDTKLNCLVTRFDVANGVATSRALILDTARITVRGEGTVNLANERLDLTVTPRPKEASLLSLAVPVRIGGTLGSPSFLPDAASVARGVAGALAGATINPLGLLVPFVSGGTNEANPCLTVASANPAQPGQAQPAQQQPQPQPAPGLLEGLGQGLQRLFR
ncbi:MAG: AsmA family protein [Rhodospirillaceae bacterium]|nr:AsmA family protein [Rhodospirillaceae bacterium]